MQEERSKYDNLLSKYLLNQNLVGKILAKWNVKTTNTSG
jgi:hypothetical protein